MARDRSVRIKIAKDTPEEHIAKVVDVLSKIAEQALALNLGTLRGRTRAEKFNDQTHYAMTLYNDSKKEKHHFKVEL
ncbi:MAG: hypothetical protein KAS32_28820 [Candidatus Peribacteraceae bacterium]|nr:hypothetical protein [Candidatus Peribacteraceae bacterium]